MVLEFPRMMYHAVLDEVVVKTPGEMEARKMEGYSHDRGVRAHADEIREGIKVVEAALKAAKERLKAMEKEAFENRYAATELPVVETLESADDETVIAAAPAHVCPVCGKEFQSAIALSGHKRSHKSRK